MDLTVICQWFVRVCSSEILWLNSSNAYLFFSILVHLTLKLDTVHFWDWDFTLKSTNVIVSLTAVALKTKIRGSPKSRNHSRLYNPSSRCWNISVDEWRHIGSVHSVGITRNISIYPLGTMDFCCKPHGNPANSCPDIFRILIQSSQPHGGDPPKSASFMLWGPWVYEILSTNIVKLWALCCEIGD